MKKFEENTFKIPVVVFNEHVYNLRYVFTFV